ncbi:hypothetical protein CJF42_24160 [Pseudoalteromonas sp. NBT06-2]|uniref:YHYH protein n=1 Tax=Pseudoalteromonas sp. NBT06-2 TaxID=2025950 RepID=UPI000BA75038|nr:YHYH protein [Pseudoalteromonas sp. NBT06-2]PAJ71905.1 hypothetical protein CJF42_24160 [Pseudoalteromonas sp. NBT06-2]
MQKKAFILIMLFMLSACGGTSNEDSITDDSDGNLTEGYVFNESLMNTPESVSMENCILLDGTTAECYKVTFNSNPVEHGPYCPETIDDIGGVGIYDGETNPGFQVMKRELWEAMEADGYDVVDDNNNINIVDPGAGGALDGSACLEATPDDNLTLTFLIPATPKNATSNNTIDIVEHLGVSKDGIPITGHPPSATQGPQGMTASSDSAGIPAIDPCGGHIDPFGYYHLHFGSEEMENVLTANELSDFVMCYNFVQSETDFIGYAKDGYPIYASKDQNDTIPENIDECQGHTSATADYPNGVYHYHVSNSSAPNLPTCLKGVSAEDAFTYQ